MRYWWVNQNQTYRHEVGGGYLWSPMTNANGARNQFYEFMTEVQPGDIVFSFADTYIKAIGIATSIAQPCVKPDEFGSAGSNWSNLGWLVEVEYQELERPFRPKDHMAAIGPLLPSKYSPLQQNGNGLQGVYLAAVPPLMGEVLMELAAGQFTLGEEIAQPAIEDSTNEEAMRLLLTRADVPPAVVTQLVNARRGQGLFRARVRVLEPGCRVTGVREKHHLRASHIKPWAKSTDEEKLHAANGLLLAPHIDHLFDRGFISFDDNGEMLASPRLEADVHERWSLGKRERPRAFLTDQKHFLEFHRSNIFKATLSA